MKNTLIPIIVIIGLAFGYTIAAEDFRLLDITILLMILIFFFSYIRQDKFNKLFKLLILSVLLAPLSYNIRLSTIQITPSEVIVIFIFLNLALLWIDNKLPTYLNYNLKAIITFFIIFLTGGILTFLNARTGINELTHSCIIPFLIVISSFLLINNEEKINKSIRYSCYSALSFIVITILSFLTGFASNIPGHLEAGILTFNVDIGKINYVVWGNWLGAFAAMMTPVCMIMAFSSHNFKTKLVYLCGIFLSISFAYMSGTRGGIIGTGIAISVMFFLLALRINIYYKDYKQILLMAVSIAVAVIIIGTVISSDLKYKIFSIIYNPFESGSIGYRLNLLDTTYAYISTNITGMGFNELWVRKGLDEANFFVYILNGTGLIGGIGLLGIFLLFTVKYFIALWSRNKSVVLYSILGLSMLATTLFTANSSDQILHQPQSVLPFWIILAATAKSSYVNI